MKLNLFNIFYLAFRMGPFILVSYFVLSSIFMQDFKSIIYLAGLLFTCFIVVLTANNLPFNNDAAAAAINPANVMVCTPLTLTGEAPLSNWPLSLVIYTYTLFYLATIMGLQNRAKRMTVISHNLTILILFPVLIVADVIFQWRWGCSSWRQMVGSIVLGGSLGTAWSAIIASSNLASLQYMSVFSNAQVCSMPSKTMFRCTKKPKGQAPKEQASKEKT